MVSNERGLQLHDRITRGRQLSQQEHADLQIWYAQQDNIEAQSIGIATKDDLRLTLQHQIEQTLNQLIAISSKIQSMIKENDLIRQENASLRQKVERLFVSKSA